MQKFKHLVKILHPREPVSAFSHLLGVILAIIGTYALFKSIPEGANSKYYISYFVFGFSLLVLYLASSVYHLLSVPEKVINILRRVDHMMIYVLIAGTYTPMCLMILEGWWRWTILTVAWVMAVLGIIFKIIWFNAPRWLSTLTYIIMGWMVVVAIWPISKTIAMPGLILLILGGFFYSFGAIIYAVKWPRLRIPHFGFHEIFHIFVLAGSVSHYFLVYKYL